MTLRGLVVGMVLVALAGPVAAASTLVEVVFEGNDVTQRSTLMRQLTVKIGEPIDAKAAEASRQSIQDLGLFKSVTAELEAVEAGQRLRIRVEEKFYLLPIPRIDFNSDREFSFGFKLDWSNVAGLNHDLEVLWEDSENAEDELGNDRLAEVSYNAPFFMDSAYDLATSASQRRTPVTEPVNGVEATFEERVFDYRLLVFRQLGDRRFGTGWRAGGGLRWNSQRFANDPSPPSIGQATSIILQADYRDLRDRLFSREGYTVGMRYEFAMDDIASNYEFAVFTAGGQWIMPVGQIEHQTVGLFGQVGSYHAGSPNRRSPAFGLGGGSNLRGFDKASFEGDAFWFTAVEYQRPVFGTPVLRGLLILDAGAAYDDWGAVTASDIQVDVGIGIRWRIQAFVDLTVELGVAWPLTAGGSEPFFGKVR